MKTFLAIYLGTAARLERSDWGKLSDEERKQRERAGIEAWMQWGRTHAASIVDQGAPLGRTKRVGPEGIGDTKNAMTGYVILRAESHAAAARMFEGHPHFTIFPGESIEIMECLPLPGANAQRGGAQTR